jgi:hypothetical protein
LSRQSTAKRFNLNCSSRRKEGTIMGRHTRTASKQLHVCASAALVCCVLCRFVVCCVEPES